jgi:hypothetical protein
MRSSIFWDTTRFSPLEAIDVLEGHITSIFNVLPGLLFNSENGGEHVPPKRQFTFNGLHYATSLKVAGSSPDEVDFLNLPNPYSRTMALRSTQPLTEMSIRTLLWPARKADNLTAICKSTV